MLDGMPERSRTPLVRLEPWTEDDLDLLRRINTPEMKRHVGGAETEEQVLTRHRRYVGFGPPEVGRMFRIVLGPAGTPVGSIGYWSRLWQDREVYETGWNVLPEAQGRGVASAAARLVATQAHQQRTHRYLHAFPAVDNPASNAVCRKAGFGFVAECDFEYPPGNLMRCNDWRLDLGADVEG